jgi:hypothetical protein
MKIDRPFKKKKFLTKPEIGFWKIIAAKTV